MVEPLLLVGLGAAAGLLGGMLGIGGGVLIVPALFLVSSFPLSDAVGTSLVVITGTSILASVGYLRRGLAEIDLALDVEIGALVGALAAAWWAPAIPERWIAAIFAVVLGLAAVRLAWAPPSIPGAEFVEASRRRRVLGLTPVVGGASGLLGIGGGLLLVPILRLLARMDMRRAVATSTLTVGWTASVAAVVYLRRGEISLAAVPGLLLGVFAGSLAAPWLGGRVPRRALEIVFAAVLLWAAVRMVWR